MNSLLAIISVTVLSLAIGLFSTARGQSRSDWRSCKVPLSCENSQGTTVSAGLFAAGRPGKTGPAGIRGPPGLTGLNGSKGSKGSKGNTGSKGSRGSRGRDRTKPTCPQTKFRFPREGQITDLIRVIEPIRQLTEATICAWIHSSRSSSSHFGVWSYANVQYNNAFLLFIQTEVMSASFNDEDLYAPLALLGRTHVCVAISRKGGYSKVYRNGRLGAHLRDSNRSPILGEGYLVIGQEQDSHLGGYDSNQAFAGTIENFMIWYRQLDDNEIRSLYDDKCSCPSGYAIALTPDQIQIEGHVASLPVEQC